MNIKLKRLDRMLEAVTAQVNTERETAAREDIEYGDPIFEEQENNTEHGFLLARLEEFLVELESELKSRGRCVVEIEDL